MVLLGNNPFVSRAVFVHKCVCIQMNMSVYLCVCMCVLCRLCKCGYMCTWSCMCVYVWLGACMVHGVRATNFIPPIPPNLTKFVGLQKANHQKPLSSAAMRCSFKQCPKGCSNHLSRACISINITLVRLLRMCLSLKRLWHNPWTTQVWQIWITFNKTQRQLS
jgi:hypothetical protein